MSIRDHHTFAEYDETVTHRAADDAAFRRVHLEAFNYKGKTVELDDSVAIGESGKALLVLYEEEEKWIPYTHISAWSDLQHPGDEGTLVCSEWIAEQKGWA